MAGTDARGTSAYGLVHSAESLGFTARGVKGTIASLTTANNLPLPAIAHVITEKGMLHYVVIHRIKQGIITIADPAQGIRKLTTHEFARIWSGVLIVLAPAQDGLVQGPGDQGLRRFLTLLTGHGKFLALVGLASVLITITGIVTAFYFKVIIDEIVPSQLWRTLTAVSIAILALYVIKALLDAARYQLVLHVQQRIDIPLVLGYYNHVVALPMSFYGTRRVGDIITRFGDASKIRTALASATVTVFVDVLMSIGGSVVLARQDMTLFAIAVAVALAHVVLGAIAFRPVHRLNEQIMEANAGVTSHFVESIEGAETVKAYNAQDRIKDKADLLYVGYLRKLFRSGEWHNAQTVIGAGLRSVGTAVVLWVGTIRVLDGGMTLGGLVVFSTLLNYFLDPVERLVGLQPELQSAAVAARRLGDVLVLEAEELGSDTQATITRIDKSIIMKDVSFRYGTRRPVLTDLTLTIPPGAVVGLVGESGSGKTTVSKLLMKFYAAESGHITFGDLAIEDICAESLRDRIAYVSQDTTFFSGTIEENLRLARPDATAQQMITACQVAQAHDFIAEMPARYQSYLEENAANLSGGQRQRLAIARALLRGADMLILDEATSNMDSLSERAVTETLRELASDMTSLVIAHRLSTVVACDIIYVMQEGTVVESGTHEELLSQGKVYAKLWNAQAAEPHRPRPKPVLGTPGTVPEDTSTARLRVVA